MALDDALPRPLASIVGRSFDACQYPLATSYLVTRGVGLYDAVVAGRETPEDGSAAFDAGFDEAGLASVSRLRRELARGTAELAVLSVLNSGRRYGYELLKMLERAGPGVLELKEGTLYPLLHRLEDAGHITATWVAEGRARPRKYYDITADGHAYLAVLRAEWTGLVRAMWNLLDSLGEVNS